MNLVDWQLHLTNRAADRMADEWQRHSLAAPVVAAAAPLFAAGALPLRREAVIKIEPRIALQRRQVALFRKCVRGTDDVAAPVAAAFGFARIEQFQIAA